MVTCESNQYRIPFKACRNSEIKHDLVTVHLNVEWPKKGGDDPILIINITNKKPSTYIPQNQSLSSSLVHHYPHPQQQQKQQENCCPTFQNPQYYNPHSDFALNNYDSLHSTTPMTLGDHNDVSSTTTLSLFDIIQPQSQLSSSPPSSSSPSTTASTTTTSSSLAIQQIKNDLKSQLSPVFRRPSTSAMSQYSAYQEVIQAPLSNISDSLSDMQLPTTNPPLSIKSVSSISSNIHDQQQSPTTSYTPMRSYICHCSNPTNYHEHNCPVITSTKQNSAINFVSNNSCQTQDNRTLASQMNYSMQTQSNDTFLTSSTKETIQIQTTGLPSFSSCSFLQTSDVGTIVSPQTSFLNNNSIGATIKFSPMIASKSNNFQQHSSTFPPVTANFQSNTLTTSLIVSPRNISASNTCQQSQQPMEQTTPFNQERTTFSNFNDCQSQIQVTKRLNSFLQQHRNHDTPSLPQTSYSNTTGNPFTSRSLSEISANDSRENCTQHVSTANSTVRSPVSLGDGLSENSVQKLLNNAAIDQTIIDVSKGEGVISLDDRSMQTNSLKQNPSLSPKLVWEQNGPVTTKTYLSPLESKQSVFSYDSNFSSISHQTLTNITPQNIRPPAMNHNGMQMFVELQAAPKTKKRIRTKLMNETGTKRNRKTNVQKFQSPKTSPTVTSTSTFISKSISPSNMSHSTESILTTNVSIDNLNQHSSNDVQQTTVDIEFGNTLSNIFTPARTSEQTIYLGRTYDFDLDEDYSSKNDEHFNPSTPPPPPLSATQVLSPSIPIVQSSPPLMSLATEKSFTTSSDAVYKNFLSPHTLSSTSAWQENQVTSSVVTPPGIQNTSASQYQHQYQSFEHSDLNGQTQNIVIGYWFFFFMELNVGRIVWARRTKDDIYWPGKIMIVSNNTNDLWSSASVLNYHVQFFVTNQSAWLTDLLPYVQYRDSMTNESFMNYGLHPTIKSDFINAIQQANYANNNETYVNTNDSMMMTIQSQEQRNLIPTVEYNTNNDFLLTTNSMFTLNTEYYNAPYQQISVPSSDSNTLSTCSFSSNNNNNNNNNQNNQLLTINHDWYAQQGLLVESITPPLPSENDNPPVYTPPSVIIITTKNYNNPSFISFIFNSLSNIFHTTLLYIEHLSNYQHPSSTTLTYLVCFDHFQPSLQQTLDTTILNNLNAHVNYYFLLMNTPSQSFVKYFYSKIMDKRSIMVVHYHSPFESDPLLLCSGNRGTYEILRSTFLKYLCSKMKFIESHGDKDELLYSAYVISSIMQSSNILNHFVDEQIQQTLNENFDLNFLQNNQNVIDELFPRISMNKNSNSNALNDFIQISNTEILENKEKQSIIMYDLLQNGAINSNPPPPMFELYTQTILQDK
ncbi:hypothetical protein I4U23_007910 [Adineta vaga]|nr:hypothetical protein I4U23_007910 [Adineta vaga]